MNVHADDLRGSGLFGPSERSNGRHLEWKSLLPSGTGGNKSVLWQCRVSGDVWVREIPYLTEEDYQTQSLVAQKSSASFPANCTPLVTLTANQRADEVKIANNQKRSKRANMTTFFNSTSSRVPSSCISPSICSTNSSVSRIFVDEELLDAWKRTAAAWTRAFVRCG